MTPRATSLSIALSALLLVSGSLNFTPTEGEPVAPTESQAHREPPRRVRASAEQGPTKTQPRSTTASAPVIVFGDNRGDAVRSESVFARFASAGLALVDLEVHFRSSDGGCKGYEGLHTYTRGSHLISICAADARMRTRTLLHEVAHVWVAQNVDEEARTDFLEQRGLPTWHGPGDWRDRGTEHAAEIVAWGISDNPCWARPVTTPIRNESLKTLTEAFRLLTGLAPQCDSDAVRPSPKPAQEIP